MIRSKTSEVEVISNLGADRLKMAIDPAGMVHITDLLTNMYSDEELAVLREYSTNARDSHIVRGHGKGYNPERPIEVTLPVSSWELPSETRGRFLKIRDYGVGLSVEEIAEIYSFYGKSTKDEDNEQNGMMGIGGKSGLVDTFGSFKLTGIKDGKKTIVMVGRNEATEPVMDLVSVTETDEPQGVEIELPAPKRHWLRDRAEHLFKFWPEGSVLVDGKAPKRLKAKIQVTPEILIAEGLEHNYSRSDFIVMADVPYPVQLDGKLADGHSLVVYVPTGAVDIAPSREALRMTERTKDEIARLMAEYDQKVQTVIQDSVAAAKSKAEAVQVAMRWRSSFASKRELDVKWRGQKLPMYFEAGKVHKYDGKMAGAIIVTKHDDDKLSRHDRNEKIFVGTLVDSVLVHGYNVTGRFAPVHKRKLEKWAKDHGFEPEHYVLTENKIAHGWINSTMRVDWETVKAIKVNQVKDKDGTPRIKGSYPMWTGRDEYSNGTPAADIDTSRPIFWCDPTFMSCTGGYGRNSKTYRSMIYDRYPDAYVVELTSNRITKFERDFPQARRARVIFDEIYAELEAKVTPRDRKRFAVEACGNVHLLKTLDKDRVEDPEVKKAIRWANTKVNEPLKEYMDKVLRQIGRSHSHNLTVKWKNPLDAYPLASAHHLEHTYTYMNAVYAATKESK